MVSAGVRWSPCSMQRRTRSATLSSSSRSCGAALTTRPEVFRAQHERQDVLVEGRDHRAGDHSGVVLLTMPLEIPSGPDAEVRFPLPQGQALNSRSHWATRAKQTKHAREYAEPAGGVVTVDPPMDQAIVLVRWQGRGRLPDVDNIAGRCKAYIDGLQDAGWWLDDTNIIWLITGRERIAKGEEPHIIIKAWRAEDGKAEIRNGKRPIE